MYKLTQLLFNQVEASCVIRTTDGAVIPFAEDNTDYIAYLQWIAEGNTPEPADEPN